MAPDLSVDTFYQLHLVKKVREFDQSLKNILKAILKTAVVILRRLINHSDSNQQPSRNLFLTRENLLARGGGTPS